MSAARGGPGRTGRGPLATGLAALGLLVSGVRGVFATAAALCFVVMVGSITLQVLGRYVLPFPIADAVEVSSFAQVWLVCLGAGLAVRHRALFTVDLFGGRLSPRLSAARRVAVALLGLVFIAALFKGSLRLIAFGQFQTAPTLGIEMWIIYMALPIGLAYFLFELVVAVFEPPRVAGSGGR